MYFAIIAALIAGLFFAIGGVLQQRVASTRPEGESLSPRLIWDLLHQRLWVAGISCAVLSYVFQALALNFAPLAVVQPIIVSELLFAIPITGWLYSSATGVQVVYLGLMPLPDLVHKSRALGDVLRLVHVDLNALLFVGVSVHAAAAVRHHVVDRDAVLARMLPLVKPNHAR